MRVTKKDLIAEFDAAWKKAGEADSDMYRQSRVFYEQLPDDFEVELGDGES